MISKILGHYQVTSQIGKGGMGEVYLALDTKLEREVAIKVLPEEFARDAERMARFQREAKLLATLNHTNIATIHGIEDSDNTHALVMELAEGPTLADRIRQGPIPVEEAIPIARQMADALEYAHERGIIHRDLKPANVKVAPDDTVKILDFGLAKAMEIESPAAEQANSPTLSHLATQAGVLLGTAAYMAPEQAKGKPVDRRADIWAFGCVLYEMLTGKSAFRGETMTETLAAVIKNEPDWSLIPDATPTRVRVLLQRCFQKDPRQRLRDMGDARISLDEVLSGAADPGVAVPFWRRAMPWAAGLLAVAAAGFAGWNLKPSSSGEQQHVTRAVVALPPGQFLAGMESGPAIALSPDGTHLAYVARQGVVRQIYLREMDSLEARAIPGTEGAMSPFFSQDGQWVGFFTGSRLKKVSINGGAALSLCDAQDSAGASWGSQGIIAFNPRGFGALQQVSDSGGTPQPLTLSGKGDNSHCWPEFLPGSTALIFAAAPGTSNWTTAQVAVYSFATGEKQNLQGQVGTMPRYAPSGHLIYAQAGILMAVAFDSQRLQATGTVVPVVDGVLESPTTGNAQYSLSSNGTLAYISGSVQGGQSRLVWVSRNGTEQVLAAPVRAYLNPRLSPDGRRVAVSTSEQESQTWLYDLARGTLTRLTFEGNSNQYPVWTPDGKHIVYRSNKEGPLNLFWRLADGSGGLERLSISDNTQTANSISPDGQVIVSVESAPTTGLDIWVLPVGVPSTSSGQAGQVRKARPFLQTRFTEGAPQFSPDGRWLAYVSDESGTREIYVQAYPGPGGKWQISTNGGNEPVWNRNGRELFFRSGDKMMAVEINTQAGFTAGEPRILFEKAYERTPITFPNYDVSPDGQRFLMLKSVEQEQAGPTQINVVLNWTEELKRLVPTAVK
jgi:Tol biopolymer transport system component